MKLTVTVITHNESGHISAALDSVAWADEIIVVDSESTDGTADIARAKATRVLTRAWAGYSDQKNFAAEQATHDWVLSMDADERVTPALAGEIQALLQQGPRARGYRIRRVSWCTWPLDPIDGLVSRLPAAVCDRRAGRWNGRRIHESFHLTEGEHSRLHGELEHYPYRDISHHLKKIDAYTTLSAEQSHENGHRASLPGITLHPAFAFFRNYVLRGGYRDGTAGLIISVLNAYYVFLKQAKLWERHARREFGAPGSGSGTAKPD